MAQGSNPDRLRSDIDRGRAGDKIPHPDPAAAPLGTDEEAAGTPVPPEAMARARAQEVRRPPQSRPEAPAEFRRSLVVWGGLAAAFAVAALLILSA